MITLNLSDIRFMQMVLSLSQGHRELFDKLASTKEKLITDEVSVELSGLCEERLATHGFDAYHSSNVSRLRQNLDRGSYRRRRTG